MRARFAFPVRLAVIAGALAVVLVGGRRSAAAQPAAGVSRAGNPLFGLKDGELARYRAEPPAPLRPAGERFLDDLSARDPRVTAAVEDAVRYRLQSEEANKFARQKRYVLAAYGVLFAIVAGFTSLLYLRQRRLAAAIAELEARLAADSASPPACSSSRPPAPVTYLPAAVTYLPAADGQAT